jgi:hypothetical protein
MNFKGQIEQILEKRKMELPKVEAEVKRIRNLATGLTQICDLLRQLDPQGEGALDFGQVIAELDNKRQLLADAEKEADYLRHRFERKTINIGVSGRVHVGKSSLLQSLSGLKNEQIPTADQGSPITAVRSRIFNQPRNMQPKAIVKYYDKRAFFDKFITTHLRIFAWNIRSLTELEQYNFPSDVSNLHLSNPDEGRHNLKKLKEAQEALKYNLGDYLTGATETITDLQKLKYYTAYPTDEELEKEPEARKRLYLAVEDIQIYCHFPSLDEVSLGLVDLPGLGEASQNVDDIQIEGLEKEVDHVTLVLRPTPVSAFVDGITTRNLGTLYGIQKSIKDRGNFVSIIVNKDNEKLTADLLNDITKTQNDGVENKNYTVYVIKSIEPDSALSMLENILTRLADKLPVMDNDALESYRVKQNIQGIKDVLVQVREKINGIARTKVGNRRQISAKALKLHRVIAQTFMKELIRLKEDKEIDGDEYFVKIEQIRADIEQNINNGLFKGEQWEDFADGKYAKVGSPVGLFDNECNRLRIQISLAYEVLTERYYKPRLESFWEYIAQLFRTDTGIFLSNDVSGGDAINAIYNKIKSGRELKYFEEAFQWLKTLHFDFRQSVYPDLREALQDVEAFNSNRDPQYLLDANDIPHNRVIPYIKELLQAQATAANYNVVKRLKENAGLVRSFIYSALEHFDDLLIKADEDETLLEFEDFCDQFRADIWPEEYGKGINTESKLYAEICSSIDTVVSIIQG